MANRKETLLKEGTIRRFMKLAYLEPLSENFLDSYTLEEEEEEPTPEEAEYDAAFEEEGEEEGELAGLEAEEEPGAAAAHGRGIGESRRHRRRRPHSRNCKPRCSKTSPEEIRCPPDKEVLNA